MFQVKDLDLNLIHIFLSLKYDIDPLPSYSSATENPWNLPSLCRKSSQCGT